MCGISFDHWHIYMLARRSVRRFILEVYCNYPFSRCCELGGDLIKGADRLDLVVFVGIFLRGQPVAIKMRLEIGLLLKNAPPDGEKS